MSIDQVLATQKEIAQGKAAATQLDGLDRPLVLFSRILVENYMEREVLAAEMAVLEKQLAESLEEAKKGAWKRRGVEVKETVPVATLRAKIADVAAKGAALVVSAATAQGIIDEYRQWEIQDTEMAAWLIGGPTPAHIRQRQEAEQAALLEGCVSLLLPVRAITLQAPRATKEEVATEEWVQMTAAEYLDTLKPPPELEEEIVVPMAVETTTPGWITRFMAKAKAKAKVA